MSDGPVFVERIGYEAAVDAAWDNGYSMDDVVVKRIVAAALVGVRVIRREDIIEFTLTDNGIGVEDKDQVVVGCCYDEGPYWNLEAGRYLLIPLAAAEEEEK